ncbi:hypothetical protein AB0J80_11895 [Actinoplanes sp. NPDC049548]|uniref:hypothetical protein n=1 Tax=Actinoplanes sp. NPDC049548 TaxID=3155152 RepID=UPI0034173017
MTSDSSPKTWDFTKDQTEAGWRSMSLLARLVQRGGHPAPVKPTVALGAGEKQYGAFLANMLAYYSADVDYSSGIFASGGFFFTSASSAPRSGWRLQGRQAVTLTSQRLVMRGSDGEQAYEFRSLILIQPNPLDWSVNLYFQGAQPMMLRGPWVPWMTVVMSAELYGSPWPPGHAPTMQMPVKALCENP